MADSECLRLWENLKLGYTESQGHPLLRQEIAGIYNQLSARDILLVTPEEGIFLVINVLLGKGDHVVVTFPGYQSLYQIAESMGCEVSYWRPQKGKNWCFELEDLTACIKKNTRLLVINFPHNPTGAMISPQQIHELLTYARERNIYIFSDEMYRLLEHDGIKPLPSVADIYQDSVSLFGMSKSFALAGLRLGWLSTRNRQIMEKLTVFKDYTTICSSAPSEILALIAMRNREQILRRNRDIIARNLKDAGSLFDQFKHLLLWRAPQAGTVALPELLVTDDISNFCTSLIATKGVMLMPASVYDYPGPFFRMGFGRENFSQGLALLAEFLQQNY
jgi:aspartate/methionine/tyrosine aminotransferase